MVQKITRERAIAVSSMIAPMNAKVLSSPEGAEFYLLAKERLMGSYVVLAIDFLGSLWVSDEEYRGEFERFIAEN